jgi:hypothetical protein
LAGPIETPEAKVARMDREEQLIRDGIADVNTAWARLESAMAHLLSVVLNVDVDKAYRVYFSPTNTQTRFEMVSAAIGSGEFREKWPGLIQCLWERIAVKLRSHRGKRNKVAHWAPHRDAEEVRFLPPLSDIETMIEIFSPGQKMGMTGHDLKGIAAAINRTEHRVQHFTTALNLYRAGDVASLQEIVILLTGYRRV